MQNNIWLADVYLIFTDPMDITVNDFTIARQEFTIGTGGEITMDNGQIIAHYSPSYNMWYLRANGGQYYKKLVIKNMTDMDDYRRGWDACKTACMRALEYDR